MNVIEILSQKGLKKLQAREMLVQIITEEGFSFEDCKDKLETLKDKQIATFLEAVEAVSGQKGNKLDIA